MIRTVVRALLRFFYGFEAFNEAVLQTRGPVLLLPNHVSWWDWILIGVCLEDDWKFVTSSTTAEKSWLHRRIMVNGRTFPVDMNSPYAVKHMAEHLQRGGRLVMFPEGRISATGTLMKLFDGTGFLVAKTHAKVITAYLRGAEHFPYSGNPCWKSWFPRVSVHFSEIQEAPALGRMSMTETRHELTDWLWVRMVEQQFEVEMRLGPETLHEGITGNARHMKGKVIFEDLSLKQLTYRRLLTGADLLGQQWRQLWGDKPGRIGVLLPNVNTMPAVVLSLWAANKVPAILNYTTGPGIMLACSRVAGLRAVITARSFVEKANLDLSAMEEAGVKFIYLEDIRPRIRGVAKVLAALRHYFRPSLRHSGQKGSDTAVVLFTSGSEGEPKGVELTHRNFLANVRQLLAVVDLTEQDRFFNALPLFHSFGLLVGLILPVLRGVFTFLYISPLHYKVVPSAFYNLDCTVMFGTNTFLNGYARKAHPYDFRSLRYLFAGAEKLQEATSLAWMKHFGVRVFEGYGVTECSPCISVNLPQRNKMGSAGPLLPGMEYRLEPVEGVSGPDGRVGRLLVRGPNVMRGYLNPEANAKSQALKGWYDTGDIVRVDDHQFLYILGRLKRFAKVSGEMVSLTAVEEALANSFPEYGLKFAVAVVTRPDESKGERLVVVTNEPRLGLEEVRQAIRARGLGNLAVPREIRFLNELPRLGTGKVNHRELARMVQTDEVPADPQLIAP